MPLDRWPATYPSVAQSRYLLEQGVREPMIIDAHAHRDRRGLRGDDPPRGRRPTGSASSTRASTGTAIEHLDRGLFEAHARDEAGWDEEAGHQHMWFAARDIAFEHPVTEDQTADDARAHGHPAPAATPPTPDEMRRAHARGARRSTTSTSRSR